MKPALVLQDEPQAAAESTLVALPECQAIRSTSDFPRSLPPSPGSR